MGRLRPTPRRVLWATALSLCLALTLVVVWQGFSASTLPRLLEGIAVAVIGAVAIGGPVVWLAVRLAGWSQPESEAEFEALVQRSERLARGEAEAEDLYEDDGLDDDLGWDDVDPYDEHDFDALVRAALDDLPLEFTRALAQVPVVVSDGGRRRRAYGLYQGDTAARDDYPDRIVIFRDTLLRDFGSDPEELRAQVTRTVRHELAHHLGWDEQGVRELGL